MKFLKISSEEKELQFAYLIGLWLIFTILFIVICFSGYSNAEIRGAKIVMEDISETNNLQNEQLLNIKHIDSLSQLLTMFNPENKQSYLESSIIFELNELKKLYEKKQHDASYSIFMKTHNLYSMLYYDKKAAWNTINNTTFLNKNLSDCEIGFQQNQNNITIQDALNNSANNANKE
jgi:hypothetical protein